MNKGITSIVAGIAMMGAVENTNAQKNTVAYQNEIKKEQTYQALTTAQHDEKTLKLEINSSEPLPQALKHLTTIGKTKDQREKIADPAELQKIYETQLAAYNATKQELRALKKQGKDIKELVKKMKEYNPAIMPSKIEELKATQKLKEAQNTIKKKDEIIKVENQKQKNIEKEKEKGQEDLKEKDINIKTTKQMIIRLSKREKNLQDPQAKSELESIIKIYDDIYGPGSYLQQGGLGKNTRSILNQVLNNNQ